MHLAADVSRRLASRKLALDDLDDEQVATFDAAREPQQRRCGGIRTGHLLSYRAAKPGHQPAPLKTAWASRLLRTPASCSPASTARIPPGGFPSSNTAGGIQNALNGAHRSSPTSLTPSSTPLPHCRSTTHFQAVQHQGNARRTSALLPQQSDSLHWGRVRIRHGADIWKHGEFPDAQEASLLSNQGVFVPSADSGSASTPISISCRAFRLS